MGKREVVVERSKCLCFVEVGDDGGVGIVDDTGNMGKLWFGWRAELVYLKFLGCLVSCFNKTRMTEDVLGIERKMELRRKSF